MSIAVYSLIPGGAIPSLQQVCEQGYETNTPIVLTDTPSGQQWILSGTDLTTDVGTDKIKIALYTGIELIKYDGGGAEIYSNRLFPQLIAMVNDTTYNGAVKNFIYAHRIDFAFNTSNRFILLAGGNASDVPTIEMVKIQGGGTSALTLNPIATSANAESYLPYDTTTNLSAFQMRNTLAGTVTLVAGVGTVSNSNVKNVSVLQPSLKTPGGTMGLKWKVALSGTTFTITSVDASGATVITDTSVLDYLIQF
jgi:hypothetical protein